jgi:hypothetical protein
MQRLSDQLVDAVYTPADQRVLKALVDLVPVFDQGQPTVTIRVTQEELATMAGVRRQAVHHALRDAKDRGLVRIRRAAIDVLDRSALSQRAEGARQPHR